MSTLSFNHMPTTIVFGIGAVKELRCDGKHALLLVGSGYKNNLLLQKIVERKLSNQGIKYKILEKKSGEPNSNAINKINNEISQHVDCIIGIGGGSVLDTAKFLAILKFNGGLCEDYEYGDRKINGALPIYLIPTTSGSGSEVTQYSVVINSKTKRKFTISHKELYPRVAYVDPQLSYGLSYYHSLSTGLDAITHNLEVLLNSEENHIIYPISLYGLELGVINLPLLDQRQNDTKIGEKLTLASLMGGVSISQSRTGLIHTISVALSEVSNTAHGILNAYILPYVLQSNLPYYKGKLSRILNIVFKKSYISDEEAFIFFKKWIMQLTSNNKYININKTIIEEKIEHLINRVLQDQGLQSVNPCPVDRDKLIRIFKKMIINAY